MPGKAAVGVAIPNGEPHRVYIRDVVGNVTRPVKELKGFERVKLAPGQSVRVSFMVHTDELAFYNRKMVRVVEPGMFHVWIGGSSQADMWSEFEVVERAAEHVANIG